MKLFKYISIAIISSILLFTQSSFADSRADKAALKSLENMTKAAKKASSVYKDEGMSGLISESRKCYDELEKQIFYCIYIDVASKIIDQLIIDSYKSNGVTIPPNSYFNDQQIQDRISPVMIRTFSNVDDANRYIHALNSALSTIVPRELTKALRKK